MNRFNSILLPLDGSQEAAKGAGCALWLAETLGATLHVLHADVQPFPEHETLAALHVPNARHPHVVLHQMRDNADAAVLNAISAYDADLVVMTTRGESASGGQGLPKLLGSIAQAVLEHTPVPVLVFPAHYQEALPWKSILAAASGEAAADQALEAAAHLAAALKLTVTVVHVHDHTAAAGPAPLGTYSDSAYHEYPHRMEEMVERGLSGCTPSESYRVDQILLRQGEPARALLMEAESRANSIIALGWHGAFGVGHAPILKELLENSKAPLLLLRKAEHSETLLKVGSKFETEARRHIQIN